MTAELPSLPTRQTESARLHLAQMTLESGATLDEVFQAACRISAETLHVARVGIWLRHEEEQALRCAMLLESASGEFVEGATLQLNDVPKYFAALQHRKMLPSEHAQSDPFTSELVESYLKPLGITSLLDAPILVAGNVAGVVCHEHVGVPREWTTEERDFAASIADLLGTKLRVAELHQLRSMLELSEDRLMKLERSDALAKMALGVAHDFRNILTAIGNCAEVLAQQMSPENLDSVSIIQQSCARGSHLIRHLAEFGKNSPGHPEVVSIRAVIEKFMPMLRMAVGRSHQIDLQIDPSPGKLLIDSDELLRALINLVVNAKESMPNGGTIDLRILTWKKSRNFGSAKLAIEVRDHGCGMSEATLHRLFDPFFTTKPNGCGLGMPIVQRAVERVGGNIEVESKLGVGTTIRILLPVVSREDASFGV